MTQNVVYNMDSMEYMRTLPDKAFDLCVADPPYGINVTGRHVKWELETDVAQAEGHIQTVKSNEPPIHTHTHTHTHKRRLSVEQVGRSAVNVQSSVVGGAVGKIQRENGKVTYINRNFIPCSTIAPRRTRRYSGSWNG